MISREKLLENLEKIRASLCCYANSEKFCDCKYNPEFSRSRRGEHTGCPEVRKVIRLLELIPEDEFAALLKKADNYATVTQ